MKAYIPHYRPLTERHESIFSTCKQLDLEPMIIGAYDKEDIPSNRAQSEKDSEEWNNRLKLIMPIIQANANIEFNDKLTPQWSRYRKLKMSEVSLTYKHFISLLHIAASKEPGLVFEDDILIKPESSLNLKQALKILENHADYIDLGGGCELPTFDSDCLVESQERFVRTYPPRSRTTAAYAVTSDAALVIANELFPCIFPLDWSFQYIFVKNNLRVVWTQPSCLLHGSQNSMPSSIQ